MRLPTNPGPLPTTTPTLPSVLAKRERGRQHVGADVASPRTISSSRITFAGLKKCRPTTAAGREVADGDRVDVERGRVGGEDASGLRDAIELAKHLLLQRHVLEHGLDDEIGVADAASNVDAADRMDAREPLADRRPR